MPCDTFRTDGVGNLVKKDDYVVVTIPAYGSGLYLGKVMKLSGDTSFRVFIASKRKIMTRYYGQVVKLTEVTLQQRQLVEDALAVFRQRHPYAR